MSVFGTNKDEFVTSLAALALYDGDAEVTSENIATLLSASGNTVASYWPSLFAGSLKNGAIDNLVFTIGGGAFGSGLAATPVTGPAVGAGVAVPKEEKAKEVEVDVMDGGLDMFGGGGGGGGDY